jgi:hypothetical protein
MSLLDVLEAEARRQQRAAMSPRDLIAEALREAGPPREIRLPAAIAAPPAPPRAADRPPPPGPAARQQRGASDPWRHWSRGP